MPWYQRPVGAMTGWTTSTSSSTNTYTSYFGGGSTTTTSGWGDTGGSVLWVNQMLPFSEQPSASQLLNRYQQQINRQHEYNRLMMEQEEDRANELYDSMGRRQAELDAAIARQAMTAEQRQAEAALLAEHNRQAAERTAAAQTARERALGLLLGKLTPEQRRTFDVNGWFIVEGSRTKTKYRIRKSGYQGNIDVLDVNNRVTYRLCVHCAHDIPLEDHLLSQKIMLELAEDDIVRLANRHVA